MEYRIELRNRNFDLVEIIQDDAYNISWSYDRIGGCRNFSFTLARPFNSPKVIGGFFNVVMQKRNSANNFTNLFSGFVEVKRPHLSEKESIMVEGIGYVGQLRNVVVDTTYSNKEISVIVKDILDNFVVPNTEISYDVGDIESTGFTADSLEFKTTALQAFETLAEITGTREWGVGSDRKFFFKARSSVIGFRFVQGAKIKDFKPTFDFRSIKNKLFLEGGDVAGTKYTREKSNTASIIKFGTLEEIIQNTSIITNTVADQYLGAILDDKFDLNIRAKLSLVNHEDQFESSIPLGLVEILERGVRYGEDFYGNFLYSGNLEYQINSISYKIDKPGGELKATLDLGTAKTSLSESIRQLDFRIEQLRQGRI